MTLTYSCFASSSLISSFSIGDKEVGRDTGLITKKPSRIRYLEDCNLRDKAADKRGKLRCQKHIPSSNSVYNICHRPSALHTEKLSQQVSVNSPGSTELDDVRDWVNNIDHQISSPLDAGMRKKKIMKKVTADRNPLKIQTDGLSLTNKVQNCDDGMSPLMERFQAKRKK